MLNKSLVEYIDMCILPVASGKGGVGKTTLATNLAVALGRSGKKVILTDLDFGGSNLHLFLGFRSNTKTIGSYLNGQVNSLSDLIVPSGYPNVDFIPGNSRPLGVTDIRVEQKRRLIRDLCSLNADYLILDLGAGSSLSIVDFFLLSKRSIIVTAPNSAAIISSYIFLKSVVFRIMVSCFGIESAGWNFLQNLQESGLSIKELHMGKISKDLQKIDPINFQRFKNIHGTFRPRLILNLVNASQEVHKGGKLHRYVKHYLGLSMDYLGIVLRDEVQSHALSGGIPIVLYKPHGIMSRGILRIVEDLLSDKIHPSNQDSDIYSFCLLALSHAQQDYQAKINSLEGSYKNKDITDAELLEVLRNQQYEVNHLRKENRFLKRNLDKNLDK